MRSSSKPAAKKAAPAKAAPAKAAPAKAGARPAAKPAGVATPRAKAPAKAATPARPARWAVARPVTRVVKREEDRRGAQPPGPRERQAPRPKAEPRPLPTAPAGHAPLIALDGSASGSVELPAAIASPARRRGVVAQAMLAGLANARQATAATKNRSRVAGGGAKPWRQKGTGRARQGSTRAPHWRHGGVVFGPNGRRYAQRLPGKMRRSAFAQAMGARAAAGRVLVVEGIRFAEERPRTREVAAWLQGIGDLGNAVLVTADHDQKIGVAAANLHERLQLRTPGSIRLADVLGADTLLVMRPALDALARRATVEASA
ncbi:MAG: 50S ribosomal protein L4 [Chloroflexi bacterium]|nr:MAG: 50S ribosomal protein L4 [Chloroflexota bacterium]